MRPSMAVLTTIDTQKQEVIYTASLDAPPEAASSSTPPPSMAGQMIEDAEDYEEVEVGPETALETPVSAAAPGPTQFPCVGCQAECYQGQRLCTGCRYRLTAAKGEDKRLLQAATRRNRILDRLAAAGVNMANVKPYELQKIAKRKPAEEHGQMSWEAREIRGAKDKVQRAAKIKGANYTGRSLWS